MAIENVYIKDTIPPNLAGKSKKIDDKAVETVTNVFEKWLNARDLTIGGENINVKESLDELYRLYKNIYRKEDHNYNGRAEIFIPLARKAVNVSYANLNKAIFSNEDYFKIDVSLEETTKKRRMSKITKDILKYYNDKEDWIYQFKLAAKQSAIYGPTVVETIFEKQEYEQIYRFEKPLLDKMSGEPLFTEIETEQGPIVKPLTTIEMKKQKVVIDRPKIEVRDIYRFYCNPMLNDPTEDDIIYRDEMSAQKLLKLAEQGVYAKGAVDDLLNTSGTFARSSGLATDDVDGDGKSFVDEVSNADDKSSRKYEVLRFQGLFTVESEDKTIKLHKQFWIDLGERCHVLRIIENPLVNQDKTFSCSTYDRTAFEFYSDSAISPIKDMIYEVNDKENQSLDAVSEQINAPFMVSKKTGINNIEWKKAKHIPKYPIVYNDGGQVAQLPLRYDVTHIRAEITALNEYIEIGSGAVPIVQGRATGTQADRSGKALNEIKIEALEHFTDCISAFENTLIKKAIQKAWNMILLFGTDELILEDIEGNPYKQNVKEVVGSVNVIVNNGSQYVQQGMIKNQMLEFLSICSINDQFMAAIDIPKLVEYIAVLSPHNIERFVNPDSIYAKQQEQIKQLLDVLQQIQGATVQQQKEIKRLSGELAQTDRAAAATPQQQPMQGMTQ
jgi:hypothetical protein